MIAVDFTILLPSSDGKKDGVEESETTCSFWASDTETSGKAYRFKVKISSDSYVEINLSGDYQRTAASLLLVKE